MSKSLEQQPVVVVIRASDKIKRRARYVFDTLFVALGIPARFQDVPPERGPWILYGPPNGMGDLARCLVIACIPDSWSLFDVDLDASTRTVVDDQPIVLPLRAEGLPGVVNVDFDIIANAFYFLSSWSERLRQHQARSRMLFSDSVFARLGIPQDVVDGYLEYIEQKLHSVAERVGTSLPDRRQWPENREYALVLSHDVDFLPNGLSGTLQQGARTFLRHLVRQRRPRQALSSMIGLARALASGRDAYGCVPEIIAEEKRRGVRSSFQVAVGHRHPQDVTYRIHDPRTRDYLRHITDAGFDLCLHGSYRSTENPAWYAEEVRKLAAELAAPTGSRQHFLSFDYDALFGIQEQCGIRFDMSMGFPDSPGPRAGFSFPYFPYNLAEDRPYKVLEISLFLMDVTFQGYLALSPQDAYLQVDAWLADLRRKRGGASLVWHPIVFGGARDPGYDRLYWAIVERVLSTQGLATDGATIDSYWRSRSRAYASFSDC